MTQETISVQIQSIEISEWARDRGRYDLFDLVYSYWRDGKKHTVLRKNCAVCFNAQMINGDDATLFELYFESVNLDENEVILNGD